MSFRRPSRSTRAVRPAVGASAVVALATCGLVLTGCAADPRESGDLATPTDMAGSSAAATAQARVGDLIVSGGFVPQPASPDVAAAYLTITNTGSTDDTLVAAASDAGTASLHRTVGGAMVPLDQLQIPAHTSAGFAPGANHIMIENRTRSLRQGDSVILTLTFERAGEVAVDVPVTGYPTGGMGGMDDMGGMGTGGMDGGS